MKAEKVIWLVSGLVSSFLLLHFTHTRGVIVNDPAGASMPSRSEALTIPHDSMFRSLLLHNGALHADFDGSIPFERRASAARQAGKEFLSSRTNDYVLVYIKVNGAMSGAILCSR